MRALIDRILGQFREFLGRLTKKERIRLALLAIMVITLAIVVTSLLGRTKYGMLKAGLSQAEAGEIYAALTEMGVPVKLEGTTVYVPESRVSELQNTLAAQGYFAATGFDTSIIDGATGFSVTEAQQKIYNEYQRGQSIDQQLMDIDKIQSSKTLVTLGENSPFASSQNTEATASVMLTIRGGAALTNAEANQIADIIRASVPGIKDENISVKDTKLNTYTIGEMNVDISSDVASHRAYENQLRQLYKTQVEQLLTPIFGATNVVVSPNVELNFDRVVTQVVEFSPPIAGEMEGIARSASELYELQRTDAAAEGAVGTETNGMGAGTPEYPYGTLEDGELYSKTLLETNYEINETRTSIEKALGQVESLTVSVLIDSEAVAEDYTNQVINLVSMTLGISEDHIAVERIPFTVHEKTPEELAAEMEQLSKQARLREILELVIMWGVILLLGLSFMSLVRMIVKNLVKKEQPVIAGGGIDLMVDEETINYEDIDLNAKPDGVEQLEKFIDKDARAVAALLRNWLADD